MRQNEGPGPVLLPNGGKIFPSPVASSRRRDQQQPTCSFVKKQAKTDDDHDGALWGLVNMSEPPEFPQGPECSKTLLFYARNSQNMDIIANVPRKADVKNRCGITK